jgi:uncharacterized protein YkwD
LGYVVMVASILAMVFEIRWTITAALVASYLFTQAKPLTAFTASAARGAVAYPEVERGIIAETNRLRTDPRAYAKVLAEWRQRFRGRRARVAPNVFLETREGTSAVDEAIAALQKTAPLTPLRPSRGLAAAARDHVLYQGYRGLVGHGGRNRSTPFERMNNYGRWLHSAGENISYGAAAPMAVVRDLLVDDGVPDRSHRVNLLRPDFRVTGVACGPHKTYRIMCVIGYAAQFEEKSYNLPKRR